jgi:hypothetical protein
MPELDLPYSRTMRNGRASQTKTLNYSQSLNIDRQELNLDP